MNQIGAGQATFSLTPVSPTVTGVVALSAGFEGYCAVLFDGDVTCWGAAGAMSESMLVKPVPALVPGVHGATAIAAGGFTVCAVAAGQVLCWGNNPLPPVPVAPTPIPFPKSATAVAVGTDMVSGTFVCALLIDKTVACWGDGRFGELGTFGVDCSSSGSCPGPALIPNLSGVRSIAAGTSGTACAVLEDGSAWCWGAGNSGSLGNGALSGPDLCGPSSLPCAKTPVRVSGLTDVVSIAAGDGSACALLASGAVECWGSDSLGSLGNGTDGVPSAVPVPVIGF
jgi:alpha-tubulin suppressor-like RCC1 family protein